MNSGKPADSTIPPIRAVTPSVYMLKHVTLPLAHEPSRPAERLEQRAIAIKSYQFVVDVWRHADSELQPHVVEARDRLQRLVAETPSERQ